MNIQATGGNPPAYGHTQVMTVNHLQPGTIHQAEFSQLQVNIDIEDVNDNPPEFESATVRISVPENVDLGTPLYAANAHDRDSGKSGVVSYRITNIVGDSAASGTSTQPASYSSLFAVDWKTGHLTLLRHLDYETTQRHTLVVTATDSGEPPLSANLTILVEVQDVNDNPPVFERNEYAINIVESMPVNSQVSYRYSRIIVPGGFSSIVIIEFRTFSDKDQALRVQRVSLATLQ